LDWKAQLIELIRDASKKGPIAIIGLGNPLRGDDAIGNYIALGLKGFLRDVQGVEVIIAEDRVENVMNRVKKLKPSLIIFLDAIRSHAEPGTIILKDLEELAEPEGYTHKIPLKLLLRLSGIDSESYVLGVQARAIDFGKGLSEPVKRSGDELIEFLKNTLRRFSRH